MPLGRGVRYRVKTTKSGKKIRLAFRGNEVIETKDLGTGETHMVGGPLARAGRLAGKRKKRG